MGKLTRIFDFDAAHRVMNEKMKCFNLHGHRFHVELTFRYSEVTALGYAIDFKEIKRLAGTWLDESFDHATILNPLDEELIAFCKSICKQSHCLTLLFCWFVPVNDYAV